MLIADEKRDDGVVPSKQCQSEVTTSLGARLIAAHRHSSFAVLKNGLWACGAWLRRVA